jgi:hypothetical protein
MARIKYFNGTRELKNIFSMDNKEFAARFPGVRGKRYDGYSKQVGYPMEGVGGPLPVERVIEYKSNPSKHACDARCVNAQGKIMRCECSCGGVNHGKGAFSSLLAG